MISNRTPSPAAPPRRRRRDPKPPDRVTYAVEALTAIASLAPAIGSGRLRQALRWPQAKLAVVLAALERSGLVEVWDDPGRPGEGRVMLSDRATARLGLELAPRGDRRNPDRPPAARPRRRGSDGR